MKTFRYLFLITCISLSANGMAGALQANKLLCEYQINPIGIDIQTPRLSWQIVSNANNVLQTAYEIRVAESPANLKNKKKLIWSTGKVISNQSIHVDYKGAPLSSMQRVYWQVRSWDNQNNLSEWSEPAFWEMGILDSTDWKASWIGMKNDKKENVSLPCQYFRKPFNTIKKIQSARVYVSSHGLYQLFFNGQKLSNDLFTPGWTSYKNRIQYQTYDVTSLIKNQNVIGAIVGDGWYRGRIGWAAETGFYGNQLALICMLKLNFSDGTTQEITTDETWKVSYGPILKSDIYNGETYDARLEMDGWSSVEFNDKEWQLAQTVNHPTSTLIAPQAEAVEAIEEITPKALLTTAAGETVFDMGQNMVGWVRLNVSGNSGDKLTIKYAEVLDKQGNFYADNLRTAQSTDVYILNGKGEEVYEPHFTFHGFRYVKIEGLKTKADIQQLKGIVIHTKMKPTGTFSCSEPLINQLQHNIQWGQKGNFLDVPTDCPQRDERLGWTGDAQVFCKTAAFNYNVAPFFTKWMKDVAVDQSKDGRIPWVVPDVIPGAGGVAAWGDVATIIPWTIYLTYGDKRILSEQYSSMKAWVDYMHSRAGEDHIWTGDFHFGDWLSFSTTKPDYPGAYTDKDLIATAYYYYSCHLLAKTAAIIGKTEDAAKYNQLASKIKDAFISEYVTPTGRVLSNTQTAYALALKFGLLPEDLYVKAAQHLAADVEKMGHLTTGFVGTPLLCNALSDFGRDDVAFMLLNRKQYPSWLYPVTMGATTIWERWDGIKPDSTFQDKEMNSFNHYAYGAIGEWLYGYVAGINIDPEVPGFKNIILKPHVGGGLTHANAEYQSLYGLIKSAWKVNGNEFQYAVEVPSNTSATVILPFILVDQLKINNKPIDDKIRRNTITNEKSITINIGSGNYQFSIPLTNK